MNTSFFGELLQTISERGRALHRPRAASGAAPIRPARRAWWNWPSTCCPAAARPPAWRWRAKSCRRYAELTTGPRIAFFEALAERFGPDPARMEAAIAAWREKPSDATAAEVHAASEPRRQELFRRLNLAPGGTAALVRMREQLMDVLAHRDADLGQVDADFVHLFSSWFNRGFLVLRRIDWSTPAIVLEKIIRYEAVHEIHGWDDLRRAHRSARPALLRLLPSGAGGRAADLRRGGAHPRHPRRHRADPGDRARGGRRRQGAHRGVLFDLQLPARACRRVVRQFPHQAGGRGDQPRNAAAVDLRDAVAGHRLCRLAQARARAGIFRRAERGRQGRACRARRGRLVGGPGAGRAPAGPGDARGGLVSGARAQRRAACRSIRSRASISATAPGSSASTGWPTCRTRRWRRPTG